MSSGVMRFRRAVVVSFADENTLSHGTEEPGIGTMSIARRNIVGYRNRFSCVELESIYHGVRCKNCYEPARNSKSMFRIPYPLEITLLRVRGS